MLPFVCSVIDHRWRQNVVRTKKWHTRHSQVCHWCSYHILTSSVIYYWIKHTATWNLFVLYNNAKPFFISKCFNENPGICAAFAHFGKDEKKPFDIIYDLYKMEQFHWLVCVAKNCGCSRKITPLSNRLSNLIWASPLVEWTAIMTAKAELNCKIYKSWSQMLGKSSQFLSSEQPCEPKSMDIAGVEKIPSENFVAAVNLEAIWFKILM